MRSASTDAYHLAMLVTVVLLVGGAAVNAAGIRRLRPDEATAGEEATAVVPGT